MGGPLRDARRAPRGGPGIPSCRPPLRRAEWTVSPEPRRTPASVKWAPMKGCAIASISMNGARHSAIRASPENASARGFRRKRNATASAPIRSDACLRDRMPMRLALAEIAGAERLSRRTRTQPCRSRCPAPTRATAGGPPSRTQRRPRCRTREDLEVREEREAHDEPLAHRRQRDQSDVGGHLPEAAQVGRGRR